MCGLSECCAECQKNCFELIKFQRETRTQRAMPKRNANGEHAKDTLCISRR